MRKQRAVSLGVLTLLALALGLANEARAERLPIRHYTAEDGLASNRVTRIVRDSQGFLWFCTTDGLSRFDGQRFTTFRLQAGSVNSFNDLLETRNGEFWAATNGSGVCRFNYSPRSLGVKTDELFTVFPVGETMLTNSVNALCEDRDGRIWAGTDSGLFVLDSAKGRQSFVPVNLNIASHPDTFVQVWAIIQDEAGSLWIGTKYGIVRLANERMIYYTVRPRPDGTDMVHELFKDKDGRLWIGHAAGLGILKPLATAADRGGQPLWQTRAWQRRGANFADSELPSAPGQALWLTSTGGLGGATVRRVRQVSDGRVYILSQGGYLTEFDGRRLRTYSTAQGLGKEMRALAEDTDGNLWLGTSFVGVIRLAQTGLVTYGAADGLKSAWIERVFEDREGALYFWGDGWRLHRFDGSRFSSVRINLPSHVAEADWRRDQIIKDRAGQWWVSTRVGLFRFPRVSRIEELARARPVAVYTTREGLAGNDVRKLFEDSRGDVWISTFAPDREVVTRWERATARFQRYSVADGLPPKRVTSFGEDAAGNVWLGFWGGGLARYQAGRFTLFTVKNGVPERSVIGMHLDSAGRLWVAFEMPGGLYQVDASAAEHPHFVGYAAQLTGNRGPITEDAQGRLYFGTLSGLARLDLSSEQVSCYTTADGLASTEIFSAYRDRQGKLWFGTGDGLSRLTPAPDRERAPLPVFISALRVGGVSQPISVFGQTEVASLEVGPGQNQVQIEFFGLSFAAGAPLRYQYRMDGLDADWGEPSDQHTFYANLRPGQYRFLVRAVRSDGAVSPQPASFAFRILPPFWQRWWFLALVLTAVGLVVYLFHHYRVARLLELERVHTRIATDLHDDVGASLSQVAVITEVLRRQLEPADPRIAHNLSLIARVSREVVDSLSDIVWAINPQKDNLHDLTRRMRRFASETLAARDIQLHFHAPASEPAVKLGVDVRRQVFLIFKETINNILRHADCSETRIALSLDGAWLVLAVSDNGKGLNPEQTPEQSFDGHGLASMKQRAERLGGGLEIHAPTGQGTTVTLKIPQRTRLR